MNVDNKVAVGAIVVTMFTAILAYWCESGWLHEMLVVLTGAGIGLALFKLDSVISAVVNPLRFPVVVRFAVRYALPVILGSVSAYGVLYWGVVPPPVPRPPVYPCSSGEIADFRGFPGSSAVTCVGSPWSMFSDNAINLHSTVQYARISVDKDASDSGEGFMRLFFQLHSIDDRQPFVGVFADFSYPPATAFDVSMFKALSFKLRMGQSINDAPVTVSVILYSSNIRDPSYIFPRIDVLQHEMTPDWVTVRHALTEFSPPKGYVYIAKIDTKKIYRVGIMVTGKAGRDIHGQIDISHLWFER